MQAYSNPKRESEPYSLPDVWITELTAEEQVQNNEDLMWEASKKFPLMHMNSRDRDKAIAWALEESGCTGGIFWCCCLPGCLPDSSFNGPFATYEEALADAQSGNE